MEIRDPIHGSIYFSEAEVKILDRPEYQRLRAIKQLGFSEFSFPGATHTRYLHSIGACHLAGLAFDSIFKIHPFSKSSVKARFRQLVRLASLLHDVGHGPLSHTTEQVMPPAKDLKISIYANEKINRKASHEDYTIKYVLDSKLALTLKQNFPDILPIHIACLIDKNLISPDDSFIDNKVDYRPILSQLVSSELDVDRMDYLLRDSYFCGTTYGQIDLHWILQNLTFHLNGIDKAYLALNRRALYSFDDFLISRHHMHLMIYCHHKSIIYEEMLNRYLTSPDCSFQLPADINQYTAYNDYKLHEHLASSKNPWARRIAERRPFKVLTEKHSTKESSRPQKIQKILQDQGLEVIWASSKNRLSKYHQSSEDIGPSYDIFVVDQYDRWDKPSRIMESTEIFKRYEGARIIDRIYVEPEKIQMAEKILETHRDKI